MKAHVSIVLIALWSTSCAGQNIVAESQATTVTELSQKLATGKFHTVYDHGKLVKCEVTESTGDAALDRAFCEIAEACAVEYPPHVGVGGDSCMDRKQSDVFARIIAERSTPKNERN